jgi:Glycosyl transferase family 2
MDRLSVGVLVTYFGEQELLRECLESVAEQTEPVDEVLVYDDASDAPAEDFIPHGLPVTVLRGEVNRGPAHGRNRLLFASQSDYVHFHDADDLFAPEWHACVRDVLEVQDVDAVFTEIDAVDEADTRSERILALANLTPGADLVRHCIQGVMLVPSGTYRRDRALAIRGYRESLHQAEDFDFHVRLAASGVTYAAIKASLVTIRVREAGRSRNQAQTWSCYLEAVALLANELPAKYRPELADAAARAGSKLFRLGARREADAAFELARQFGPPRFSNQRGAYRLLARTVGYRPAEQLAQAYRGILPAGLRQRLAHALEGTR